ncbi:hypothetical protein [Bacillus sp. CECT 9360]|uniref:hypothetical protein n=1 Tax=Bacillus sp. CECT 9360 TaxID=2845821 RepID=UPI001E33E3D5|nr:hypothetical protein [Bacillus sp. CECT 9360]CAH0344391.1 hypothetical protein BCI9360_00644 [Bacillus sp. CECT 9360]
MKDKEVLNNVISIISRARKIKLSSTYDLLDEIQRVQERASQVIDKNLNEDSNSKATRDHIVSQQDDSEEGNLCK